MPKSRFTHLPVVRLVAFAATLGMVGCAEQSVELPEPFTRVRTERILLVEPPPERYDILFVVDTSPLMQGLRTNVIANARHFAHLLNSFPGGRPDLHIAAISSDMGTAGGPGAAGCSSLGDNGAFYTGGMLLTDERAFLDDSQERGAPGQRLQNFQGSLSEAMVNLLTLPPSACRYAQPMRAISRALFPLAGDPGSIGNQSGAGTAGFIRADAMLVVVIISVNDDCSLAPQFLSQQIPEGEATAFRCFANSFICDEAAATVGPHHNCRPTNQPGELSAEILYKKLFQLKVNTAKSLSKLFVSIVASDAQGAAGAVVVPSANAGSFDLAQACTTTQGSSVVANPSLRLQDFAARVRNNSGTSICNAYFGDALNTIATRFPEWSNGFGPRCFDSKLVEPFDCAFTEYRDFGEVRQRERLLPMCDATKSNTPCVRIATDPVRCPAPSPGLSADFDAGRSEVFPGTVIGVECVTTD